MNSFLEEGSKNENRGAPCTVDDYILTPKNIPDDFLYSFDLNEHYNYNQKEDRKKEPQSEDHLSPKKKDWQNKGKMSR